MASVLLPLYILYNRVALTLPAPPSRPLSIITIHRPNIPSRRESSHHPSVALSTSTQAGPSPHCSSGHEHDGQEEETKRRREGGMQRETIETLREAPYLPEGDMAVCVGIGGQVAPVWSEGHGCDGSFMAVDVLERQRVRERERE